MALNFTNKRTLDGNEDFMTDVNPELMTGCATAIKIDPTDIIYVCTYIPLHTFSVFVHAYVPWTTSTKQMRHR
jgi:Na+-translocating ferredoxin:NAD+ oxidoreductase RNF subunit RnfB